MHVGIDEGQRQEVFNGTYDVDAISAVEEYADGLLVAVFHFEDDLPACSTGCDRTWHESVFVSCRYSQLDGSQLWMYALCSKDGGAFGTEIGRAHV